jgi:Holliday junction resolvase RusA-like endonuclease
MTLTSDPFRLVNHIGGQLRAGLLAIKILATPMAQPRPRVSRNGGVYYPETFMKYQGELQRQIAQCPKRGLSGPLAVVVESVLPKPKTTKFETPQGDVDNFAKGALDVATKVGVWEDDRQITMLVSTKRWAEAGEQPHTLIHIGQL